MRSYSSSTTTAFSLSRVCAIVFDRAASTYSSKLMAKELDPLKLSSPRIFLLRMLVFVILVGLLGFVLYKQIQTAFMANPGLNALILGVGAIGIILSFRQVLRLYPEIAWVNNFRLADPGLAVDRPPVLLAPMASILGSRVGRMAMSPQLMRGILDSIATRLDEARDISRYMTGLLVFLGLLGTFWGLIETVSSVGGVIQGLKAGGDAGSMFDSLREGLAAPLSGMGISFSSSLFGLAGSLVLGFLDLQSSQAQNRFYTGARGLACPPPSTIRAAEPARRHRRDAAKFVPQSSGCAAQSTRSRRGQVRSDRDGQSCRGDPGPCAPYAHRAADDPRLGRLAGCAAARDQEAPGGHGARAR